MKISESWLREWVNPNIDTDALAHSLTMAGLEVDGVELAAAAFSGVVIAEVLAKEPHPDAEKLSVCQVSDGSNAFQVVCGATNVAAGLRVPFATVGAVLPGGMKIKAAKLRGVASHGMLCGASELGLEDVVDGLLALPQDAPLGEDFRQWLNLDDAVIEVDLTPNRGDCLSMLGIAREVGVLTGTDVTAPQFAALDAVINDSLAIELQAPAHCSRYSGRIIRDVGMTQQTPLWMRERLRRAGLRSIDPVVDVTNYVMIELGQPLHAFDLDSISVVDGSPKIVVRLATASEKLTLLDGSDVELDDDMLVIADTEKALAVAGVMGGLNSAVSGKTRNILLESAFFEPSNMAGKARRLGMHTDASHRFERGVDAQGQQRAIERATELLLEIAGGKAGPVVTQQTQPSDDNKATIQLKETQIERVLGFAMSPDQVEDIFQRLELSPQHTNDGWTVTVPAHRFDLAIEADLLEELARVYGYDNLPVEPPLAPMTFTLKPESHVGEMQFKQHLVAQGYQEAITYSFIDPKIHAAFFPEVNPVTLQNPIASDMAAMRTSLIPGLLGAAKHNLSRQQTRLKLFEAGLTFVPSDNGLEQSAYLSGLLCGPRMTESWLSKREAIGAPAAKPDQFDFYDIKADVESLLSLTSRDKSIVFRPINDEAMWRWMHPGQSAEVLIDGEVAGVVGQLHPQLHKAVDVSATIWVFELKFALISDKKVPEFKELSKFPEVRRDFAVIVDQQLDVSEVLRCAEQAAGAELIQAVLFDQYSGEGIGEGKQSIGFGLVWQHRQRTLTDDDIAAFTNDVITALQNRFGATLR